MATLNRRNANLTAEKAREVAIGPSYMTATYFVDGQPGIPVSLRPDSSAELPESDMGNGAGLDHPSIRASVERNEKQGLLDRKKAGELMGDIRPRPSNPATGEVYEWDHWTFTLDRNETAWLQANPDKEAQFLEIVQGGLRQHPTDNGTRQALITGIHKDTGNWHIQGLIHRWAVDNSDPNVSRVSKAVDFTNNSAVSKFCETIQTKLNAVGINISISSAFTNQDRSKFEERGVSDAAKSAYTDAVEAAGGIAGPRATIGPSVGPTSIAAAMQLTPELADLAAGQKMAETDAIKAVQAVEALERQLEAARAAAASEAQRKARFDQAIAALGQKDEALAAKAEAEAKLAQAESQVNALGETVTDLTTQLRDTENIVQRVSGELSAERIAREQADELAASRYAELESARETIDANNGEIAGLRGDVDRLSLDMESLRGELAAEREARTKIEAELHLERETFPEKAARWAEEKVAAPMREQMAAVQAKLDAAEARIVEMAEAVASAPQRMADAVKAALDEANRRFDNALDMLKTGGAAQLAAKDAAAAAERAQFMARIEALEAKNKAVPTAPEVAQAVQAPQAPAPVPAASTPTAEAPQATAPRTRRAAAPPAWAAKEPAEWTPAERDQAAQTLAKVQRENPGNAQLAAMDLETYGNAMHQKFNEAEAAKAKAAPEASSDAPEAPSEEDRYENKPKPPGGRR